MPLSCAAGDHLLQGGDADPVAEIAEPLAGRARCGVEREERVEHVGDFVEADAVGDRLVEPSPFEIAADIERIEPRDAPDDADIAGIGPGAAVRAAGDADAEPFALQPPARAAARRSPPTMSSLTRSASVSARPQVGSAGHASAQRCAGSRSSARST